MVPASSLSSAASLTFRGGRQHEIGGRHYLLEGQACSLRPCRGKRGGAQCLPRPRHKDTVLLKIERRDGNTRPIAPPPRPPLAPGRETGSAATANCGA